VILDGKILEKPENREHAIDMLLQLSGKTHQVITAVALLNKEKQRQLLSITDVTFAKLDKQLCEAYWQTGEPVDKAGGYAIQGKGALFISNINGSYSAVMGLPIYETHQLLEQFSFPSMILKNTNNKR
jgi:septum formation protein